jgi:hypothetical protein
MEKGYGRMKAPSQCFMLNIQLYSNTENNVTTFFNPTARSLF